MRAAWLLALLAFSCRSVPPESPRLKDYRGIIHCHSLYSHDSRGTYEEILAAARSAGVDFIIMTDHPPKEDPGKPLREGWRGLRGGVLFIQGAEYGGSHLLALGIREPVEAHGVEEKIKAIHAQGGLAFVSHPEAVETYPQGADGMEIFNVHAAFTKKRAEPGFLKEIVRALKEDPERSFRLLQELDPDVLRKWDAWSRERMVVGIAANDSHQNANFFGLQLDPYARAFGFVSTHVLAEALTEEAILGALKRGQCYVSFDLLGDPRVRDDKGAWTILRHPPLIAREGAFHLTLFPRGDPLEGRMVTDGVPSPPSEVRAVHRPEGPGVHRLEITAGGKPWILTNAIRVPGLPPE